MKLSVLANLYGAKSLDETLQILTGLGVHTVELGAGGYPGKAHCNPAELLADAAKYGKDILVEEYIKGKELTVAIFNGEALPVVHICPRSGFYDMNNKYPSLYGGVGSDYICPADISPEETAAVQAAAVAAYKALNVEVYGRVDVLLTDDGKPYVLEINTIPGMTSASLFPKAAAAAGISYGQLCTRIAEVSLNQPRG